MELKSDKHYDRPRDQPNNLVQVAVALTSLCCDMSRVFICVSSCMRMRLHVGEYRD